MRSIRKIRCVLVTLIILAIHAHLLDLRVEGFKFPSRLLIHPDLKFNLVPPTVKHRRLWATSDGEINLNIPTTTKNTFNLLSESLRNSLYKELGILEPNEVQNSSIPIAFRGEDVFIISQTGSGKTLSFLLPIIHRIDNASDEDSDRKTGCVAIVIGPTEELVEQHRNITGKLAPSIVDRILFITPVQLLSVLKNKTSKHLELNGVKIIAIDEVDAVLCGSEFDDTCPESSIEMLALLPQCQYILTTAHLTRAHTQVINKLFPDIHTVRQNSADGSDNHILVPTLQQEFHYFSGNGISARLNKLRDVLHIAAEKKPELTHCSSTIVFCRDENEVDTVHTFLAADGQTNKTYSPRKLHALLPVPQRTDALSAFRRNDRDNGSSCRLLVTHELAARGLDCPSVRHVILFYTPTDVTAFVHQAGRTARAGEDGKVTCLVQAGRSFGSIGQHKVLHELKDAPKLKFLRAQNSTDVN